MGRRAALAIGVSFAASTSARLLSILATFVLARLLIPADFGIASIGILVTAILLPLTDIGIAQALIRTTDDDLPGTARTAFWLILVFSAGLYAVVYLIAPALASFYGQPDIGPMLRVICVSLPVYAVSRIPSALLERKLDFGRKGLPDILASLAYALVATVLASVHFGFWSIVLATLLRYMVVSTGVFFVSRWYPALVFDRQVAQELIAYARYLMAGSLLRLFYTNIDNAVVGKVLGMTALGFYAMAYNLGNLVAVQISEPVGRVLFPLYSRMLPDVRRVASAALLMLRYVGLVISPITTVGIVAVGSLVPLLIGPKWLPLVLSTQILLIYGWARTLAPIHWALMLAGDLNKQSLRINVIGLALALLAAYPAARLYSFNGVAALFTALEIGRLAWMVQADRARFRLGWIKQLSALQPGLIGGVLAAVALIGMQRLLAPDSLIKLGLELAGAAAVYSSWLFAIGELRPSRLRELRLTLLSRGAPSPAAG